MKMMKAASFILMTLLVGACATTPGYGKSNLNGMVYDYDNQPVPSAQIRIDDERTAVSDVNGRFFLADIEPGTYSISVKREGFESIQVNLDYTKQNQILYVKMYSADQLLALAEKALEKRDWDTTESYLKRAGKIRSDNASVRFIQSVILFRKGDAQQARTELEKMIADGANDPFIHLFLADILQYRLNQPKEAIPHLEKFLDSRYDPDIEKRKEELKK